MSDDEKPAWKTGDTVYVMASASFVGQPYRGDLMFKGVVGEENPIPTDELSEGDKEDLAWHGKCWIVHCGEHIRLMVHEVAMARTAVEAQNLPETCIHQLPSRQKSKPKLD